MTCPLLIVAGIPLATHERAKNRPARDGWTIREIPSHNYRRADVLSIWKRIMAEADDAPDAGAHLLLAHDRQSDRSCFRDLDYRCHRVT